MTRLGKSSSEAVKTLDYYIDTVTSSLITPILKVFEEEGAPFLSSFNTSSPFVEFAQSYIAGDLGLSAHLTPLDTWEAFTPPSGNFSHAKPNITDSTIFTYSHQAYNWRTTPKIDAADFYAASELGAKFKSREAIYDHFGKVNKTEVTCQEINQKAMDWLKEKWTGSEEMWTLSEKYGQPIEFVEDTVSGSGITWVNEGPVYKNTTESW